MKNIYYFRTICKLGGIETFFRELSSKYRDWDITFVYQNADPNQLEEIKQYCRCIRFNPYEWQEQGRFLECDEAFFNFNLEFLDFVKSKRNTLVVHGNYKMLNGPPPQDDRIDRVVAVSKDSAKAYTELTGIPCGVCYNPIAYKEYKRPLILIVCCRLEDRVKGGERTRFLLRSMDKYCQAYGEKYICFLFSSDKISMPNVINMEPRTDIKPYMMMADYLVQLSDNVEGYNYSVNEMLYICKKPVVITPCNVFEELGIDDTMSIKLNFDLSNTDDVIRQMFTKKFNVNYKPPMDRWDELLEKGATTYKGELKMKIKVTKAYFDVQANVSRSVGDVYVAGEDRAEYIISKGFAEKVEEQNVQEEIKTEVKEEIKEETKAKKKRK